MKDLEELLHQRQEALNVRLFETKKRVKDLEGVVNRSKSTYTVNRNQPSPSRHSRLIRLEALLNELEFNDKEQTIILHRFSIRSELDERIIKQGEHFYVDTGLYDYSDLLVVS
jgi:hypothetical protein